MAQPNGRSSLGSNTARVALSITAVRTPISPRGSVNIACKGLNPPDMLNTFCRRMALLPNTFGHDDMCCLQRRTAQRCKTASRVGPKSQAQSKLPKYRVGEHRVRNVSAVAWCPYHSQQLDSAELSVDSRDGTPRGIMPKTGGLAFFKVPRPPLPLRRRRRPLRPLFFTTSGCPVWPAIT